MAQEEEKHPFKYNESTSIIRPLSVQQLAGSDEDCPKIDLKKKKILLSPPSKASQRVLTPTSSSTSVTSPISPKKRITKDNFNLIKLLGTGAFSKVALVDDVVTGKKYAMKVMEKAFLRAVLLRLRNLKL